MVDKGEESNEVISSDAPLPFATIIVPSIFARDQLLEQCVSSLLQIDYPRFEILIVDNRPTSPTKLPDWAIYNEKINVLHQPIPGISAARNLGLARAQGAIVAFTDDDVEVDPNWLRSLVNRFATNDKIACVTGLVLPRELDTAAQRWFEEYLGGFNRGSEIKLYSPIHPSRQGLIRPLVHQVICRSLTTGRTEQISLYEAVVRCGAGANMAFRTRALVDAGGFDLALGTGTATRGGEDLAIFAAILSNGSLIAYEPTAVVYHSHRRNYDELVKQVNGSGLGLTAMLTSLAYKDIRHLFIMAEHLPSALRSVIKRQFFNVNKKDTEDVTGTEAHQTYPRELRWHELLGMARGPLAYALSKRTIKATMKRHGEL